MDNLTLFGRNKRKLRKLRGMIEDWLAGRRLKLNNKWQLYPTAKRTVAALGYRFGHKFSLLRKRNMVRLKKSLSECYRACLLYTSASFCCARTVSGCPCTAYSGHTARCSVSSGQAVAVPCWQTTVRKTRQSGRHTSSVAHTHPAVSYTHLDVYKRQP